MIDLFFVEEDWSAEGEWAHGKIRTSKREVARRTGTDWKWFYTKIWTTWLEIGVVSEEKIEQGYIFLPKLAKKEDINVSPRQIKTMAADMENMAAEILELKTFKTTFFKLFAGNQEDREKAWRSYTSTLEVLHLQTGGLTPPPSDLLEKDIDPEDLPPPTSNSVKRPQQEARQVEEEAGGGGVASLSKEEKEKLIAELVNRDVFDHKAKSLVEKYDRDEILAEIVYYDKDKKANPRMNAGILVHRIESQAAKTRQIREAVLTKQRNKEQEAKRREEQAIAQAELEEQTTAEAYIEQLGPEERVELRERAINVIKDMPDIKQEFITEILIQVKEKEIVLTSYLQRQGEETGADG